MLGLTQPLIHKEKPFFHRSKTKFNGRKVQTNVHTENYYKVLSIRMPVINKYIYMAAFPALTSSNSS